MPGEHPGELRLKLTWSMPGEGPVVFRSLAVLLLAPLPRRVKRRPARGCSPGCKPAQLWVGGPS